MQLKSQRKMLSIKTLEMKFNTNSFTASFYTTIFRLLLLMYQNHATLQRLLQALVISKNKIKRLVTDRILYYFYFDKNERCYSR